MKKILVFLVLGHTCKLIHAQQRQMTPDSQRTAWLGIFAGPNLNYLDYYDKVTTIEGRSTGFHAGVFYQKGINKYFSVQPTLLFSIRGGKIKNIDSTIHASLTNIELPVNFLYVHRGLSIGAGPNFCYGISGKFKSNGRTKNAYDANESFERTLKRFELGGNFIIGYQFKKGALVKAIFSPGFTNIYKGDGSAPSNVKAKTRMFGVSVGYMFGMTTEE